MESKTWPVFSIKRFALHDGKGIRTTVFTKGCPLECKWCQNPEGIRLRKHLLHNKESCLACGTCLTKCPVGALSLYENTNLQVNRNACMLCGECIPLCPGAAFNIDSVEMSTEDVMRELEKDSVFYGEKGGVTFSGGEPLATHEFILPLLIECRKRNWTTAIESCMHCDWDIIEKVYPHIDEFYADLKVFDPHEHKKQTGIDNSLIIRNIIRLSKVHQCLIIRLPLIPGYTDSLENIKQITDFCNELGLPLEKLANNPLAKQKYADLGLEYKRAPRKT